MPLVLGSFKKDSRLDDDSNFEVPNGTVIIGKDGSVTPVNLNAMSQQDPGEEPPVDTTSETPEGEEGSGIGAGTGIDVPETTPIVNEDGTTTQVVYEWWTTAELMSYNLEFALKSRWESIGSKMLMDGLSVVKSLQDVGAAAKAAFGGGKNAPALQIGENGSGTNPDGTTTDVIPPIDVPQSADSAEKAQALIAYGEQFMGLPYTWGATGPRTFDCSGFVQYVYKNVLGINLPRQSDQQALAGTRVPRESLQPGDIVAYYGNEERPNNIGHVMIYVGNGKVMGFGKPGGVYNIDYRTGSRRFAWGVRMF